MIIGIILVAIGFRCAIDKDNEIWQTVCGILVALIGGFLAVASHFPAVMKVLL